ncbi:hypothetical protein [Albimonas pacifica]|nr:hypothetical protein [Albimonas pacifica]
MGIACAIGLGGGQAAAATAATLPCTSTNMAGDASGFSLDCQVLDAENDKADVLNGQGAFSLGDWVFASKLDIDEGKYEGAGFSIDGGAEGGSFSLDDGFWDQWSSAVILFKSANKNALKKGDVDSAGNVVMFLIQPGVVFGEFARSLGKHGISHISLYASNTNLFDGGGSAEEPLPTPLPASALMLVSALAGAGTLGMRGRRKG